MKKRQFGFVLILAVMLADLLGATGRLALCHVMPQQPPAPDCTNQLATMSVIGQKLFVLWATLTPAPDPPPLHYAPAPVEDRRAE